MTTPERFFRRSKNANVQQVWARAQKSYASTHLASSLDDRLAFVDGLAVHVVRRLVSRAINAPRLIGLDLVGLAR